MLEAGQLLQACAQVFKPGKMQGIKLMITAGPTFEPIDPVRYIGNRSSGKMGFALAEAAVEQGAQVTLVAGPVQLATPAHVTRIDVQTAQQMYDAVMQQIDQQAIFIATAAVADYRPAEVQTDKIKKSAHEFELKLQRNPDILASVAALQNPPFTLGFAAETHNEADYAIGKLQHKKLNMIAANKVAYDSSSSDAQQDSGFSSDYNTLQVFWQAKDNKIAQQAFPRARKTQLARQLLDLLATHYQNTTI